MRIVIDMQGAQSESRFRGIGRYSLSLATTMARNAGEHEVWLVLNACMHESITDVKSAFAGLIPENRIRILDVPKTHNPSPWLARASEVVRETFLETLNPDVVVVSSLFEGYWANAVTSVGAIEVSFRTAVILYDLIPYISSDTYLPTVELRDYYYRKIEWLKNADALLAISDSSREEAVKFLNVDRDRIANISAAIGDQFRPSDLGVDGSLSLLSRLGVNSAFILYAPGGFDPRKNFERLIQAYSMLPADLKNKHQLVIASKLHPQQREELLSWADKYSVSSSQLLLTGYLVDEDLVALYSLATLFVFPSTHEGFGLPVLEAMACGAAVIGSNCSSVPEVIGFEDALFDPFSSTSIAQKMKQALEDVSFRAQLTASAARQCERFSWDDSAKKALEALEALERIERPVTLDTGYSSERLICRLTEIKEAAPTAEELFSVASSIAFNFKSFTARQLLLDVSSIVHSDAKSGIQRVVRSLLQEFLSTPPENVVVRPVYYASGRYYYANSFASTINDSFSEVVDTLIDFSQDDIYLSLDLNMHLATELFPLHDHMRKMGIHVNYIVYDLLLFHRPDWWLPPNADLFVDWLDKISRAGSKLICISAAVAAEMKTWLADNPDSLNGNVVEVESFHLGADIGNSLPTSGLPDGAETVISSISAGTSFLMVSTIEPRKGHAQTLSAFERLWALGFEVNLVIVGRRGWLVDDLITRMESHPEIGRRLLWLEGISDEYLERVYTTATCLITASEGEGFGLPLIEAAQHSLPMIIRDLPVFREIALDHAYYFEGLLPENLEEAVKRWLELFNEGKHPSSSEMPWLTWQESARQLEAALLK